MPNLTIAEASESCGISIRRLQVLCREGRVEGAVRFGQRSWMIEVVNGGAIHIKPGKRGPALVRRD